MIHFDISKLVDAPRRSGIQRVERELIRYWPQRQGLLPCRFDGAALRLLPAGVLDVLAADASTAEETLSLAPLLADHGPVVPRGAAVLCAELFDDAARAAYLQAEGKQVRWLVYDFLPWLRPEWFPAGPANRLMPFLFAMRAAGRRAFISEATRQDAEARVLRRPETGPVLPLGADGLGLERQAFDAARRDIVMLGTIEARKNAAAAIQACRALWAEGAEFRLVLVGALEPDALAEQALLRELAAERRLVVRGTLPDAGLRDALRQARALLFPSQGEGYGLPPMEALHSGIPVIVAADLPALRGLPAEGQIRLARPDADAIAGALRTLLDDSAAERLWQGAARMVLPGWRDFAQAVAGWAACP